MRERRREERGGRWGLLPLIKSFLSLYGTVVLLGSSASMSEQGEGNGGVVEVDGDDEVSDSKLNKDFFFRTSPDQ